MKITQPTLLLDQKKCFQNIENMIARAQRAHVNLRPHFKTHQSATIGEWFRERGINSITVSSVSMAQYFAQNGWNDITIAFPVNILEIDAINALATQIQLNLVVEMEETIPFLEQHLSAKVGAFLKVDTGYHRTGILAEDLPSITTLLEQLKNKKKICFKGFLAHTGHNYNSSDKEEILKNHKKTVLDLNELKDRFRKDWPQLTVSLGDTPACSISEEYYGIDEIRPGNFVFYDIMQYVLGSCSEEEIAVAMASPIVAKHAWRNEVVIYGGGVHFSKEYIEADDEGTKLFGSLVKLTENGWSEILGGGYLASLSQEHGIIKCSDSLFEELKVGELIGILPIHSCMTANLMKQYLTIHGEKIEMMR
jgi:D-serine deaminase-like pyridoxal phosphate-dependent protein